MREEMVPQGQRPLPVSAHEAPAGGLHDHRDCEERLRFEVLLADLSARFVNLPADQVDAGIADAQRWVCESLGLDFSSLWQRESETSGNMVLTHHYRRVEGPPIPRIQAVESFPWSLRELLAGRRVFLPSLDALPADAGLDLEGMRYFGLQNALSFPLAVGGGEPFGAVTFHDMVTPRHWSEPVRKRLELVAEVFAHALLRKRSEQALRESNERLSLAVAAADAGLWVLDEQSQRFWVNDKTVELFGLPSGDSLHMDRFLGLVHAADRESVREAMARALASRASTTVEYRILRPDGQVRWMHSRGRLSGGRAGDPVRLTGLTSDITERKQREEALRSHMALVAAASDAAGLGFYETGEDSRVMFLDERIRALFGVPPEEEARGREFWKAHIHPEDGVRVEEGRRGVQTGGCDRLVMEYRYLHPTRGLRWFYHAARVQERNAAGLAIHAVGVIADITERKEEEEKLRESEELNRATFEQAAVGLAHVGFDGRFLRVNDRLCAIVGYTRAELLQRTFQDLTHADDLAKDLSLVRQVLSGEIDHYAMEKRYMRKDGAVVWANLTVSLMRTRTGAPLHFVSVVEDITARVAAEQALRQQELRLASAVDVAELGFYEEAGVAESRVTFPDNRVRSVAGLPPDLADDRMREYWFAHVHPDDRQRVIDWARGFDEAGGQDHVSAEYRYHHEAHGPVWLRHLVHALARDAAGRVVRLVGVMQDITEQKVAEEALKQSLAEVQRLRDQLQNENVYLREQMRSEAGHGAIIGESEPVKRMLALARKVGPTDSAVLITGETGTGKELLAQAIHDVSSRKKKLMVKVNCAALPAPLIESELFGREKGAYTGALTQQVGRFEVASGSTIFLDEIGDLPLDIQVKLLRVLQDGQYERLGSNRPMQADVRVIAATNRDLAAMVRAGKFREDLFHRLNVFPIETPPLRTRVVDIPLLAWVFIQEFNSKMGRSIDAIPKVTMERLKQYGWPGNVRELRNVIERSMIVSEGRSLRIELPQGVSLLSATPCTLEDVERKHIQDVLERTRWRIRGKGGAAEVLGLVSTTLHSRMKKLGITRPEA